MTAYFCPHCKAMCTFENAGPGRVWNRRVHSVWGCHNCSGVVYADSAKGTDAWRIVFPQVRSDAPQEYPDDVRENFDEALRSLNASNPRACVVMTRSSMQAATRQLQAKGGNLKEEIDDLADRHVIPESLRQWAHEIRDGGNLVAHPEPGKRVEIADAEELLELAESMFEYLYVVPDQIRRRRDRLSGALETQAE